MNCMRHTNHGLSIEISTSPFAEMYFQEKQKEALQKSQQKRQRSFIAPEEGQPKQKKPKPTGIAMASERRLLSVKVSV